MRQKVGLFIALTGALMVVSALRPGYATDSNDPNLGVAAVRQTESPPPQATPAELQQIKTELERDSYKQSVDILKDTQNRIMTLLVGFVVAITGYMIWRNHEEYKHAVAEAKSQLKEMRDIAKEARTTRDKAIECEEKAQETLLRINLKVDEELKKIEERGKESIAQLIKETEEQRKQSEEQARRDQRITELWSEALRLVKEAEHATAAAKWEEIVALDPDNYWAYNNWGTTLGDWANQSQGKDAEDLFRRACEKYDKAIAIKPDKHEAYNNWGTTLGDWARQSQGKDAEDLFRQACEKFEKAIAIKPDKHEAYNNWGNTLADWAGQSQGKAAEDLFRRACEKYEKAIAIKPDFHTAYNNWGNALAAWAKQSKDEVAEDLFRRACEKYEKAESIRQGAASYNLACIAALRGDIEECRKWLKLGEETGTLVTREHAMKDDDLKSVRRRKWFKEIKWKGEM